MLKNALVAALLLLNAQPVFAYKAIVIACHDGDTVRVKRVYKSQKHQADSLSSNDEKIRLAGIDAPELAQPFGIESRNYLERLIIGQKIDVAERSVDKYGRTVAELSTTHGVDINHKLVARGYAWCYPAFAKKDKKLFTLETKAREKRVGLWASANPEAPWVYRKQMASEVPLPNL